MQRRVIRHAEDTSRNKCHIKDLYCRKLVVVTMMLVYEVRDFYKIDLRGHLFDYPRVHCLTSPRKLIFVRTILRGELRKLIETIRKNIFTLRKIILSAPNSVSNPQTLPSYEFSRRSSQSPNTCSMNQDRCAFHGQGSIVCVA